MAIKIPGPPEDLVEVVGKEFPEAWDRGWHKLIGHATKAVIFEHICRGTHLTLCLNEYDAKKKYRVGNCIKCQCFFYIGPI